MRNPGQRSFVTSEEKLNSFDIDSIFKVMLNINNIYYGEIEPLLCEVVTEKFHGHSLLLIVQLQYSYEFQIRRKKKLHAEVERSNVMYTKVFFGGWKSDF